MHPEISQRAIRSFNLHLWYLTVEMVPLLLWSNEVPAVARHADMMIADRMLTIKPDVNLSAS